MRIAFLTDMHLEEDPGTGEIYAHQKAGLVDVTAGIGRAKPDLILMGGDNSGPAPPYKSSPAERNAHIEFRQQLAKVAPVIEVQGNHDYPGDYDVFNQLKSEHPIYFITDPCSVDISRSPGFGDLECVVWCLPWIFASDAGDEDHQEYARDIAATLVDEARAQRKRDAAADLRRPHILLGHAAVNGALLREGQPRVPIEDPMLDPDELIPVDDGEPLFDVALFGHYHHRQVIRTDGEGRPLGIYGGSVFIRTFGEDWNKGWCLYDTDARRFKYELIDQPGKLSVVYSPSTDKVLSFRPEIGDVSDDLSEIDFSGIDVKVVVLMAKSRVGEHIGNVEAMRAAIAKTARSLTIAYEGEVEAKTREGAAEIAEAKSLTDKIKYYLLHHAPERPDAEDVGDAIALFKEIRSEVDRKAS